ncbi:oxidoreductase [Ralstonia pseudosolanacearum]|uniref:oxidoreductase n=1 Tax=Ralstonia pseudosolanacearum TaxID=1310165 RepID=UPI0018CFF703|nr:FAD-dependent oxidoreductase [Ralstonia pseudosolanacearum]UWD88464.1 NAD(P)-binding protein [Ralstonia pseudosolanacearum]CAH0441540.1 Trimethylamine dehydrogenase [Ralstonia pseudosolanacearum]
MRAPDGMASGPARFDPLFEPVQLGPVVAKNRFYQVPHCNGMNRVHPSSMARMRGIKAEGGWGAICTEQCDIHYSGCHPRELRLWDAQDIPILAKACEEIHRHGALAGIELAHNGFHVNNLETRAIPIAPSLAPTRGIVPVTARAMDKRDIQDVRRWHRTAALNARRAGFDIVYVYASHDMTLPAHFLSRRHNRRTDEYGGSLENRVRLLRELVMDTKEAVGDRCAVALRFGVDELMGSGGLSSEGEGRDVVELLADLPDLWDVNLSPFGNDGQTSRFSDEGFQDRYIRFVKRVTGKPVVGVGRFTSPDHMLALITSGALDLIGAARPSIADPFLPEKIRNGAFDDIRECIGCNLCVASDKLSVPLRCTQNPTMGEEWRRDWHPEVIPPRDTDDRVLVIGAGPAGLEAAVWLGRRGYETILADRARHFGGRAVAESHLPGLHAWRRVADWRLGQLRKDRHVLMLPENDVTAEIALESECSLIVVATGAEWRRDGVGRTHALPIPGLDALPVYSPDDIMAGRLPAGRVLVFDDDHYYMGGVISEKLAAHGCAVEFVTPESLVSAFTVNTAEQPRIQKRLIECASNVRVSHKLSHVAADGAVISCVFSGREHFIPVDAIVLVTSQVPHDRLYHDILERIGSRDAHDAVPRVLRIGDCHAPGTIAAAVFAGHLLARTLDNVLYDAPPFRRESVAMDWNQALNTPTPRPPHAHASPNHAGRVPDAIAQYSSVVREDV